MTSFIHQIWFQGEVNIPEKYHFNISRWKELHPHYEYKLWDEHSISRFLKKHYPDYFEPWSSLDKMIKKCDCARYFILHHFGGVYADMDTLPLKDIEDLVSSYKEFEIILSEESQDPQVWKSDISSQISKESSLETVVGNAIIISSNKVDFWIEFINESFKRKNLSVLESFSTWHLTKAIDKWQLNGIKVIPYYFLLGSNESNPNAYVIHTYDATWFNHELEKPWEG